MRELLVVRELLSLILFVMLCELFDLRGYYLKTPKWNKTINNFIIIVAVAHILCA